MSENNNSSAEIRKLRKNLANAEAKIDELSEQLAAVKKNNRNVAEKIMRIQKKIDGYLEHLEAREKWEKKGKKGDANRSEMPVLLNPDDLGLCLGTRTYTVEQDPSSPNVTRLNLITDGTETPTS